jgi:gas vesicle protein GvpO
MGREDDALARRVAREARRAAVRARNGSNEEEDGMAQEAGEAGAGVDAVRAAREAARAAAMGAAAGAMRALTARPGGDGEPPARAAAERGDDSDEEADLETESEPGAGAAEPRRDRAQSPGPRRPRATTTDELARALEAAKQQLRSLQGADAETVSAFERTENGWRVTLEVVELRRIPETTDVLASYAVEVDGDGSLLAYERIRRYTRTEALDGSSP